LAGVHVALELAVDGIENMRRDVALLDEAEAGKPGARVYTWDGPWMSLGRFQRVDEAQTVPTVVRPTGGKAVPHGSDVTVSLAIPLTDLGLNSRAVKEAYRQLAKPIIAAMRACGTLAVLAERTRFSGRGQRTFDCFAFNSPNDIVDERTGKKICGCALRLTDAAVLLQASIPEPNFEAGAFAAAFQRALDESYANWTKPTALPSGSAT
jgi:lipoate-protein ligase A